MNQQQRSPFRFSIRELLLLITVVALAIPLFFTYRENAVLRRQNEFLSKEAGLLTIADASKLNIIAIPDGSLESQAWRIQLPKASGHLFQLVIVQSNIPIGADRGLPDPKNSPTLAWSIPDELQGQEFILRLDLKSDPERINWSIEGSIGSGVDVQPDQAVWKKSMANFTVNGTHGTVSFDLGLPAELMSVIRMWDDKTKTWNQNVCDGVMVFLRSFPDLSKQR